MIFRSCARGISSPSSHACSRVALTPSRAQSKRAPPQMARARFTASRAGSFSFTLHKIGRGEAKFAMPFAWPRALSVSSPTSVPVQRLAHRGLRICHHCKGRRRAPVKALAYSCGVLGYFVPPLDAACRAHRRLAAISLERLDALFCDELVAERNQEIAVHDRRAAGAAEQPAGHLERQVGTRAAKLRVATVLAARHQGADIELESFMRSGRRMALALRIAGGIARLLGAHIADQGREGAHRHVGTAVAPAKQRSFRYPQQTGQGLRASFELKRTRQRAGKNVVAQWGSLNRDQRGMNEHGGIRCPCTNAALQPHATFFIAYWCPCLARVQSVSTATDDRWVVDTATCLPLRSRPQLMAAHAISQAVASAHSSTVSPMCRSCASSCDVSAPACLACRRYR